MFRSALGQSFVDRLTSCSLCSALLRSALWGQFSQSYETERGGGEFQLLLNLRLSDKFQAGQAGMVFNQPKHYSAFLQQLVELITIGGGPGFHSLACIDSSTTAGSDIPWQGRY